MERPRIAWILGAGFSRALGGPLLEDLFSTAGATDVEVKFGLTSPHVWYFFQFGKNYPDVLGRAGSGVRLWYDAEDFLDRLDSAVAAGEASKA